MHSAQPLAQGKETSLELRAVIAAAVYATLGPDARIAAVEHGHPVANASLDPQMLAWSREGRRQIQTGHRVR